MLPIIGITITGLGALGLFLATLRIGARAPSRTNQRK
jgi:hypothetical protein